MTLNSEKVLDAAKYLLFAIGVTFFATTFCIAAAGGGHGTYVPAKLLFPWTMFIAVLTKQSIESWNLALALAQFPIYSLLLSRRKQWWKFILALHVLITILALIWPSDIF